MVGTQLVRHGLVEDNVKLTWDSKEVMQVLNGARIMRELTRPYMVTVLLLGGASNMV